MSRAVRDGIMLAGDPFDTNWAVWSIQSAAMVDDLVDLVELKMMHLAENAG